MSKAKSADLAWIVVSDFEKSRNFFKETLGCKEVSYQEAFGWSELQGAEGGMTIGISKDNDFNSIKPGQNAVITIKVEDL
jgi:hypothetical protein